MFMTKEININFEGKDKLLKIEREQYNGQFIYYVLNDDIDQLFQHAIPDHLVLMENGDSFISSPKLSEIEEAVIANQIWKVIRQQSWD